MVSCYHIFEHWRDKAITERGEVIDGSGKEGRLVVENVFLPCCFACGRPVKRKDIISWDKYGLAIEDIWKDKKINSVLERCHIVARQFGGSDSADNLFLLCSDCHQESPDTQNRAAFFRWVYRRKAECTYGINGVQFTEEMKREVEMRGYNLDEFAKKFAALSRDEKDTCLEDAWRKCGFHGTHYAVSTMMIAMIDSIESKILEQEQQKLMLRAHELKCAEAI